MRKPSEMYVASGMQNMSKIRAWNACFTTLHIFDIFDKLFVFLLFGSLLMAPRWGLSTPRAPKEMFGKKSKMCKVVKQTFRARIWTIFCMPEATYISGGFRMLRGRLGP